jgi:hypothetical protein
MTKTGWLVCAVAALLAAAPAAAGGYGFVVDVSLSPKAAAELAARKEAIIVAAMYQGEPVPVRRKYASEDGLIGLGMERVIVPASGGRAAVVGNKVIVKQIGWVKRLDVLINVYSARRSGPNNLLDCGIFEDAVAKAQEKPIRISCKLIEGE